SHRPRPARVRCSSDELQRPDGTGLDCGLHQCLVAGSGSVLEDLDEPVVTDLEVLMRGGLAHPDAFAQTVVRLDPAHWSAPFRGMKSTFSRTPQSGQVQSFGISLQAVP